MLNRIHNIFKPVVTVVIPNYNYSDYIGECIESVLVSSLDKVRYEIIIVDDSSTDNSVEVIERYMSRYKQIKLVKNNNNLGLAKTRNIAIRRARGKYIFLLDSDNYVRNDCIITHLRILDLHPEYSVCYAPVQQFEDSTKKPLGILSNKPFSKKLLREGNYIDVMTMIRKDLFDDIGMFDENMFYGWEDYELWLRAAEASKKFYFYNCEPLSFYRCHSMNMTNNSVKKNIKDIKKYINNKHNLNL